MTFKPFLNFLCALLALAVFSPTAALAQPDPLPSWNAGANKQAIIDFVSAVTEEGGADYVAPGNRIATFDNDGTLWVEHPVYTQFAFAIDQVKAMAPDHPEWQTTQPFKAAIDNDMDALLETGRKGLLEILAVTHTDMSTEDFEKSVTAWLATAKHPRFDRPYTSLAYQPMLELLEYLRANGFKTFIVSGGGIEFMRPWTEEVYGIPTEQVVGTSVVTEYKVIDGVPKLMRTPKVAFVDDKEGKPVGILTHIGKRPIAAFGNSDGDYQMLQYTTAGAGKRLGMIVHHDDAAREYAYDRDTHIGRLDQAMDDAPKEGWHLISMKNDWAKVFPE